MTHIEVGRFDTLLRRLLSIKGSEASPLLSPEIQPVIVIQDDAAELDFIKNTRRYAGAGVQVGNVGDFSAIMLINPVGSRTLAVVQMWESIAFGAFAMNQGPVIDIDLGLIGGTVFNSIDLRLNTQVAACQMRTLRQPVDNILSIYQLTAIAGGWSQSKRIPYNVVLPPGTGWGSRSSVDQTVRANCMWTERALEQSEEA